MTPGPQQSGEDKEATLLVALDAPLLVRADAAAGQARPAEGANPLLTQADPLLALVPQLRSTMHIADLGRLRAQIATLLEQFDEGLKQRIIPAASAWKARFALCTLIDEVAETMPWGAGGAWKRLNPLAGKTAGRGTEGALQQLVHLAEDPGADRDLRELVYVGVALGFDPRVGAATANGADGVRARIGTLLARPAGSAAPPLSANWRPAVGRASALATWLPLWVVSFFVAAALAILYFSLSLVISSRSDRVYAQIAALRLAGAATAAPRPAPASEARLRATLAPDPLAGIEVRDEIDRSVVTLRDDALFEPATANLLRPASESLRKVAGALQANAGQVVVLGHTDTQGERSARYPSNWELSVDRARAVSAALRGFGIAPGRLRFDGRADTEPLAGGGTAGAPVHNGRIEIILLAGR